MMWFDTIVSFHVRHDVICFKLGKCLDGEGGNLVIPWTALASSQSKKLNLARKEGEGLFTQECNKLRLAFFGFFNWIFCKSWKIEFVKVVKKCILAYI